MSKLEICGTREKSVAWIQCYVENGKQCIDFLKLQESYKKIYILSNRLSNYGLLQGSI